LVSFIADSDVLYCVSNTADVIAKTGTAYAL
jgi:hypothetical protein